MPYDGNGNFTRVMNWEEDRLNDIEIVSDRHDQEDDNFAQGLNLAFCRDGRATATGNFKMGSFKITGLGNGASSNDAVNKGQLISVQNTLQGSITAIETDLADTNFLGDIKASLQTANHGKWLLCNGQAVSRTDYADLFLLIGENFGSGDGVATFNLPDYRGKFLRGLGGDSAADIYSTQAEGLPNITGSIGGLNKIYWNNATHSGALEPNSNSGRYAYGDERVTESNGFSLDASKSNAVYGASSHVTPVNMAVNYFIKAL